MSLATDTSTGISLLSERAANEAQPKPRNLLWEILKDAWDPDTNPQGFVSLGVAENRLMHREFTQHLAHHFDADKVALTYGDGPMGSHRLRNAVARFLNKHFQPCIPLKAPHICITNGVSSSIEHVSWVLADPEDAFLLGRPFYTAFIPGITLRPQVAVIEVAFGDVDPMSLEAVAFYEVALLKAREQGVKVKGIMLCSPNNPLGRCYPRDVLIAFLRLCQKHQVHLISDEIYGLTVWENTEDSHPAPVPFESVLSITLTKLIDPSLVHVLWGMSKDFGANGVRLGCLISQSNNALHEALKSVALYSYPSAVSDHMVANILEDDSFTETYIKENQRRLSESYSYAVSILRRNNISYKPGSNAAFFLWVDLGKAYAEKHQASKDDIGEEVMQALLKQKVYIASGNNFGSEEPGIFRLIFSHPRAYLDEGLARMMRAIAVGN